MKKSIFYVLMFTFVVSAGFATLRVDEASAMPGFARKYDAPCSSCHIAFPKLNSFGIEFKQRGYRMEDEGPGEPVWKLPGIPIGGVAHLVFVNKDGPTKKVSKLKPGGLEFFFGGVLAPNVSFFGDFGADVDAGESLTPDVVFVIFDDIVSDSRLNLKVGAIDIDFPFLSDPRSPTHAGYLARLDAGGGDGVTLGRRAVEVNGFFEDSKTRYALGIGNTAVTNTENSIGAIHAWVTQDFELMGFEQSVGGIISLDKSGDELTLTDDDTSAYGGVLDLHYGLSGLILAYYNYNGNALIAEADVKSGLAEVLHSFSEKLVGIARYDFQDTDGTSEEKTQYTVDLTYFIQPNVKTKVEYANLEETDALGAVTKTKTTMLILGVGF